VPFELLEYAKEQALQSLPPRGPVPVQWLSSRRFLRLLRRAGDAARSLLQLGAGNVWRRRLEGGPTPVRRLARLLGTLPAAPRTDAELARLFALLLDRTGQVPRPRLPSSGTIASGPPAAGSIPAGPRVAFFPGCANETLLPDTGRRLRDLLRAAGCRLCEPGGLACCGALDRHLGRPDQADGLRAANVVALTGAEGGDPAWDFLVVEAAGCSLELSRYPEPVASRLRETTVLLADLELPSPLPVPLRVAIHDPCHLRHGQQVVLPPRRLLESIPELVLLEPEEPDVCCGGAGAYSLLHPELSAAMGRRKAEILAATGADLVVTSNIGCLGQITESLSLVAPELPVLPLTDLLWYSVFRSEPLG